MKVAISQSNYIPWKGYFDMINQCDVFVLYDEVQYTKNDWRNRNILKTKDGVKWLTIPVSQKSLNQTIQNTKVADKKWSRKHWSFLKANYAKTDGFKLYEETLFQAFQECAHEEYLSKINRYLIETICAILNIETTILDSEELNLDGDRNERLIDAVKKIGGDIYISGPAAKSYIDKSLFDQNDIALEWMDYSNYPEYSQLHPPFEHSVSVLDLIFNCGQNSRAYLKS